MDFNELKESLREQLSTKALLEQAKGYAYQYLDGLEGGRVFPDSEAVEALSALGGPLPDSPGDPSAILELLHEVASKATVAQSGGRYFGFVNGGNFPVGLAARWLSDAWDQNSALYVMSPAASKLEETCERWIVDLLGLPEGTAAGLVSGSSTATLCALAAARDQLLFRQGWDVHRDGLFGAPPLRVVLGEQAHSSVLKALKLLGIGQNQLQWAPADEMGRILPEKLPALDENTLLIVQAGNVNGGAFDPMGALCDLAKRVGAWVHVDGAFGLWAAASREKRHLIAGFEGADSWSADAHKTLNVPYDCGIVLCRDRAALIRAMQASGSYIQYSAARDAMLYTPEMSRRARGIELWATLKYLGREGVGALVDTLCQSARDFARGLAENGFSVLNDVVFNQIVVRCGSEEETAFTLKFIQEGGICWCGGALWQGRSAIRISVSCWRTTPEDIAACVRAFADAREAYRAGRSPS
jgi:glutamate/tyrosine decarboxylase-like PLP-dependent enzyme